ncbi:recombination repair and ssDNA binding protein [Rhizobium phage RHph_Y68]|uniref:Recombination repair and ssDNA binding protein n=1 Tax=Rhizobium phage RHph_Y68 TaxID=2509787 RepID=A0A7S5QXX7_9CAUD|nr:UvsY-like recombination mediator [Rhizobium phage RHph_Y68]QIG67961.1 recombination repair and ssDNA binding protein [Rhizobium phage RHph_Y68]
MSETKSKFEQQVEDIISEWEKDAEFGTDVSAETLRASKLHSKYWTRLLRIRYKLGAVKQSFEETEFKKNLYYTGRAAPEDYKNNPMNFNISKGELPMWMKADKELRFLNHQIECLKELEKIHTEIIGQINERKWHLQNILNSEKFKAGIN